MYQFTRFRPIIVLAVLLCALFIVLNDTTAKADAPPHAKAQQTVADVSFQGMVTYETGYTFADTEVGGLSGIVYDPRRQVYYALSDDRSQLGPARFYTLAIDVADGHLDSGDVSFLDVTTLLDENGLPYAPLSLDPEGITLGQAGFLFISSEGDVAVQPPIAPFVKRYNLEGRQTAELPVPETFLPDGSTVGVRHNLAFESLNVSPDGSYLFTASEGALVQDGPAADVGQESLVRIIQYDAHRRQPLHEYVYVTDPVAETPDPPDAFRVNGLVELLAIDDAGTFLALERSFSVGRGNIVALYEISTQGATDVSGIPVLYDEATGTPVAFEPVEKRLLLNFSDLGLVPDNLEGLALGPQLPDGRQSLIVVSDNNFSAGQTTQIILLGLDLESAPSP